MNNNLQIALDPSCIQIRNEANEYQMQISVVLTGLSFDKIDTIEEFQAAKDLLQNYYEHLKYYKIRVYFLENNLPVRFEDFEILNNVTDINQEFYNYIKNEIGVNVQKKEQLEYYFKQSNKIIEITNENFNGEDYVDAGKGYSNMAFANFSQLLPPLNEKGGLVLFSELKEIANFPTREIKFLAFPYSTNHPPANLPLDTELKLISDGLFEYKFGENIKIPSIGNIIEFGTNYICMEAEIPKAEEVRKGNVILRDDKGNFDGRVKIEVSQELDWTSDYFNKISSYFDFPRLLQGYYSQPKIIESLANQVDKNGKPIGIEIILENIEGLMWRMVLEPFMIHNKILPNDEAYLNLPIISDVDRIPKDWFQVWFKDVLKNKVNDKKNQDLVKNLKKILILENNNIKEEFQEFWKFDKDNDAFELILQEKAISLIYYKKTINDADEIKNVENNLEQLIQNWMLSWSNIIQSSFLFELPKIDGENNIDLEKRESNITGIRLIDTVVEFLKAYNTSYTGTNKELIKALKVPIRKYNESVYFYFFGESKPNNIIDSYKDLRTKLPAYWGKILGSNDTTIAGDTTIFSNLYDVNSLNLSEFDAYLIESVKGIENEITKKNTPIFDPPPIQIKVHPDSRIHNIEEDISDEIAGFILLNQRSKEINQENFEDKWHYLNTTKPSINGNRLNTKFLTPLFLPEIDGMPLLSLSLNNQKRSLVEPEFDYKYSSINPNIPTSEPSYKLEFESPEFWYGFHYRFVGFVALNSGALPPTLQNIGSVNVFNEDVKISNNNAIIKRYHHLRKVAIASPNVSPQTIGDLNKQFKHKAPPSDFNPLAKELSFWKEKEFTHFTLSESDKFNDKMTFDISKATTSFWDWFAFEAKSLSELLKLPDTDPIKIFLNKKEGDTTKNELNLPDPAVSNFILVEWWIEFPNWEVKPAFKMDCNKFKTLTFQWGKTETKYNETNNFITVKKGEIINIKFSSLVEEYLFQKDGLAQKFDPNIYPKDRFKNYYKFAPVSYCFEAAKHPEGNLETQLWELFEINDNILEKTHLEKDTSIKVFAESKAFSKDIEIEFAYISELQIRHQRWYWDGRLDVSNQDEYLNHGKELNPKKTDNYKTTKAMNWEAWSFSNRPDHTGTIYSSNLKTFKSEDNLTQVPPLKGFSGLKEQLLLTIDDKEKNKALYNRFALTAYSRYQFLDKYLPKHSPIIGKVSIEGQKIKNQWKRFIQLSRREESLPTPVVRFFIPLTESIGSKNELHENAAPIMVVVEGNVFNEAGLAYGLEIGIEKVNYEKDDNKKETYLNFGTNPTYDGIGSRPLKGTTLDSDYLVFEPQGPLGFTFDIAAENPKVNSSAYILDLSNVVLSTAIYTLQKQNPKKSDNPENLIDRHQAWSLMRVAVRSVIRNRFYRNLEENEDLTKLNSKWSEKTWVEFVQAIDSFIPSTWVEQVNQKGIVEISIKNFSVLPTFDSIYESYIERYIIVTTLESDMGGMPVESYHGTFYYDKDAGIDKLKWVHGIKTIEDVKGFMRILIVHKNEHSGFDKENLGDVWSQLFPVDDNRIRNDAKLARPMITKRVPTRFVI